MSIQNISNGTAHNPKCSTQSPSKVLTLIDKFENIIDKLENMKRTKALTLRDKFENMKPTKALTLRDKFENMKPTKALTLKDQFENMKRTKVLTLRDKFENMRQTNTSVKNTQAKSNNSNNDTKQTSPFINTAQPTPSIQQEREAENQDAQVGTNQIQNAFQPMNQTNTSVKDVQAKSSNNDTKRLSSSLYIAQAMISEKTNKKTENQDAQVGGIQVQNTAQPIYNPFAFSIVQQERETENQDAQVGTNQIQNAFQPMNQTNTSVKDVQAKSSNNDTAWISSSIYIAQPIVEEKNKKTENQDAQQKRSESESESECDWEED